MTPITSLRNVSYHREACSILGLTFLARFCEEALQNGGNQLHPANFHLLPAKSLRGQAHLEPTTCSGSNLESTFRSLALIRTNLQPNYQPRHEPLGSKREEWSDFRATSE
jgi:hypothetical protein